MQLVVSCLLFVVCCLLLVACCLLFVVWCCCRCCCCCGNGSFFSGFMCGGCAELSVPFPSCTHNNHLKSTPKSKSPDLPPDGRPPTGGTYCRRGEGDSVKHLFYINCSTPRGIHHARCVTPWLCSATLTFPGLRPVKKKRGRGAA